MIKVNKDKISQVKIDGMCVDQVLRENSVIFNKEATVTLTAESDDNATVFYMIEDQPWKKIQLQSPKLSEEIACPIGKKFYWYRYINNQNAQTELDIITVTEDVNKDVSVFPFAISVDPRLWSDDQSQSSQNWAECALEKTVQDNGWILLKAKDKVSSKAKCIVGESQIVFQPNGIDGDNITIPIGKPISVTADATQTGPIEVADYVPQNEGDYFPSQGGFFVKIGAKQKDRLKTFIFGENSVTREYTVFAESLKVTNISYSVRQVTIDYTYTRNGQEFSRTLKYPSDNIAQSSNKGLWKWKEAPTVDELQRESKSWLLEGLERSTTFCSFQSAGGLKSVNFRYSNRNNPGNFISETADVLGSKLYFFDNDDGVVYQIEAVTKQGWSFNKWSSEDYTNVEKNNLGGQYDTIVENNETWSRCLYTINKNTQNIYQHPYTSVTVKYHSTTNYVDFTNHKLGGGTQIAKVVEINFPSHSFTNQPLPKTFETIDGRWSINLEQNDPNNPNISKCFDIVDQQGSWVENLIEIGMNNGVRWRKLKVSWNFTFYLDANATITSKSLSEHYTPTNLSTLKLDHPFDQIKIVQNGSWPIIEVLYFESGIKADRPLTIRSAYTIACIDGFIEQFTYLMDLTQFKYSFIGIASPNYWEVGTISAQRAYGTGLSWNLPSSNGSVFVKYSWQGVTSNNSCFLTRQENTNVDYNGVGRTWGGFTLLDGNTLELTWPSNTAFTGISATYYYERA